MSWPSPYSFDFGRAIDLLIWKDLSSSESAWEPFSVGMWMTLVCLAFSLPSLRSFRPCLS